MSEKRFQYYAFISYSHDDTKWAEWLQCKLETYRLPSTIRRELDGRVPSHIRPIFRDKSDIGVGSLETNLRAELEDSRYLIVVCSPNSAKSEWVNREIESFRALGRGDRIIPFIVAGSPDSDDPNEQCYPPALRETKSDILGASLAELSKEEALIKIVAALLGLKFDQLWQRHKRREHRRRLVSIASVAAILVGALFGGYQYWDYNRLKQGYYHAYVEKYGIPEGLFPLSKEVVARRESSILIESQRGKVRRMVSVNSVGRPVANEQRYAYRESGTLLHIEEFDRFGQFQIKRTYSDDLRYCQFRQREGMAAANLFNAASPYGNYRTRISGFRFDYDEEGRVVKQIYTNSYDRPTATSKGNYGHSNEYGDNGLLTVQKFLGVDEKLISLDGIAMVRNRYDDTGRLVQLEFLNASGEPTLNTDYHASIEFDYDMWGNLVEENSMGQDGKQTWRNGGWASTKNRFDEHGFRVEELYFDPEGNLVEIEESGAGGELSKYDRSGNRIERTFIDSGRNAIVSKFGFSSEISSFDETGRALKISYFDKEKNPTLTKAGISVEKSRYDERGRLVGWEFFGTDGLPILHSNGFAKRTLKFDSQDRLIEEAYFGVNQEPILFKGDFAKANFRYDDRGNPTEIQLYGTDGQPRLNKRGFSKLIRRFDDRGNAIRYDYYGVDDRPAMTDGGYSTTINQFDDRGYRIRIEFLGSSGRPVNNKEGIATISINYDEKGREVERAFHDTNGEPCLNQSGYFKSISIYQDSEKPSEIQYFGVDNQLSNLPEGFAVINYEYDQRGNVTSYEYYDQNENPCIHRNLGYWKSVYKHNELGKVVEGIFFGIDGERANSNHGNSRFVTKYDEKGNTVNTTRYDMDDQVLVVQKELDSRMRNPKVEEQLKLAVSKMVASEGRNSLATAGAIRQLASFYRMGKHFVESESRYRQVLEIIQNQPEQDPGLIVQSYSNLANLLRMASKFEESESAYLRAKEIAEENFGYYHPANSAWLGLRRVYRHQKRWKDAEKLHRHAMDIAERRYGRTSWQYAYPMWGLSEILVETGHWEEAEQVARQMVAIFRAIYGEDDQRVPYHILGKVLNQVGKSVEGLNWGRKAVELWIAYLGTEDHYDLIVPYTQLACSLRDVEEFAEAREYFERAVQIGEQAQESSPSVAICHRQFAELEMRAGNLKRAEELTQRSIEIYTKIFGADHPDAVEARAYLESLRNKPEVGVGI